MPMALGGEEGRDKLRKATLRSKYPVMRRYPNGGTRWKRFQHHQMMERTRGTETSKYPKEKKIIMIP